MSTTEITLTGGPHAKNTELIVDGKRVPSAHRVELVLDVNDVARLTTYQYVSASVEMEASVEDGGFIAKIYGQVQGEDDLVGRELLAEGIAKTRREALLAAIALIPE